MYEGIKQTLGQPKRRLPLLSPPKDLLYGELVQGERPTGKPQLRCEDVCKRGLKALGIFING